MPITKSFAGASILGFGGGFLMGEFHPLQTITVGSGGASSIEFTSIPGTYQHLQIRFNAFPGGDIRLYFNGTTSTYRNHVLNGNGATAGAGSYAAPYINNGGQTNSSYCTAHIIDILDYADTSKTTVARSFWGFDQNGSGRVGINSVIWTTTSAVTQIELSSTGSIAQHGTAALYGVKS